MEAILRGQCVLAAGAGSAINSPALIPISRGGGATAE